MNRRYVLAVIVAALLGAMHPRALFASSIAITLDTTALTVAPGDASGPFSLFFQLTDGSGLDDGNNTITIDSFAFGGGGATGSATLEGGASGDLGSAVILKESSFFNAFTQGFTPGGVLSFRLSMTTNVDAGGTPDAFAFSIFDATGSPIPTLDSTLADALLVITFDSSNPAVLRFGTDPQRTAIAISAPAADPIASAVPEPASVATLTTSLVMLWVHRRRARTRR